MWSLHIWCQSKAVLNILQIFKTDEKLEVSPDVEYAT